MEAGALIRTLSRVHILVDILTSFCLTPGLSPASTCPVVSVEFSGTAASQTCSPQHILRFRGCLCSPFAGCHDGNSFPPAFELGSRGREGLPTDPGQEPPWEECRPWAATFLRERVGMGPGIHPETQWCCLARGGGISVLENGRKQDCLGCRALGPL